MSSDAPGGEGCSVPATHLVSSASGLTAIHGQIAASLRICMSVCVCVDQRGVFLAQEIASLSRGAVGRRAPH